MNNLPKQIAPTFKEEIIQILYNLFQKIEGKGISLNTYYEASIILTPKPDRHYKKTTDHYLS